MSAETERRDRLHQLLDLARVYKGWTRADLARSLARDPTKLYPDSGNPKLDFVVNLAGVLDWSVDAVIEHIWQSGPSEENAATDDVFEQLDEQARDAHARGDWPALVNAARRMNRVARSPEQRARACNRECGAWDGLGRYTLALDAISRGLQNGPLPAERRLQLQTNLANTHYTLWNLDTAHALAHVVVETYSLHPPISKIDRKNQAFALYVRGHTSRRMMDREPGSADEHARAARRDLEDSFRLYSRMAEEFADTRLAGIANTNRAGVTEVDVQLGAITPDAGIQMLMDGLEAVIRTDTALEGDWLESYGWWCVCGANIALRRLEGRELQQSMAVFTNKALEIADKLDNWALRERVFTMQYALHETLMDATGLELDFTIDGEDMRLITGTMGRFPRFRDVGWNIIRSAKYVQENLSA
ncbi:MAG: hypothetical protein KDA32_01700 [Phycisphaerales bacterium]|nr:hypothetical protein [Phycisphaerales bacterium]